MTDISAFGVVHKSYVKLRPKLGQAVMYDTKLGDHYTMDQKLRRHSNRARQGSGNIGMTLRRWTPEKRNAFLAERHMKNGEDGLRRQKIAAQGMYDAIGRNNKKKRVLP